MSPAITRNLDEARAAVSAGDFARAEALCRAVLRHAPRTADALHLLGLIACARNDLNGGRQLLTRAAESDTRNGRIAADLGACIFTAGEYHAAEASLRRAIELGEFNARTCALLGLSLAEQRRYDEAVRAFRDALKHDSGSAELHFNLALALRHNGALGEAQSSYERALELKPRYAEALNGLGDVLHAQRQTEAAALRYRDALALQPASVEAHNNLGNVLLELGQEREAESHFRRAIALQPGYAQAHYNLGNLFHSQRKYDRAIECYRRAIEVDARHLLAHHHLGTALLELGDVPSARAALSRAVQLDPAYAKAHVSLGATALEELETDAAIGHYTRALTLDPDSPEAQHGLGMTRLFRHEFELAWSLYEHRIDCEEVRPSIRNLESLESFTTRRHWRGLADLSGNVAIWGEQGIGDQLLFSTLLPDLIASCKSFVYEVDRRLLPAYERSFPGQNFVAWSDPPDSQLLQSDTSLLAGSLPGVFRGRSGAFSRQTPKLLRADPHRVAEYRQRLSSDKPKVAIAWRSTRSDRVGPKKTIELRRLASLLAVPGVQFVDVQYGDTRAERLDVAGKGLELLHFEDLDAREDLEGLLALLEACDLVITTSNATAHLAGAVGKPTWVIYPGARPPFHYWAPSENGRCLWYPSVEIVTARGWDDLVALLATKLNSRLAEPT